MRRLVRFLVPLGLAVLPLSPLAVEGKPLSVQFVAYQEVRARLERVRTECPTAAEWVKLTQKKLGLKEENDDEG